MLKKSIVADLLNRFGHVIYTKKSETVITVKIKQKKVIYVFYDQIRLVYLSNWAPVSLEWWLLEFGVRKACREYTPSSSFIGSKWKVLIHNDTTSWLIHM